MAKKKIKVLSSAVGYNLAADGYDKKEAYLNSFEKGNVLKLLGDIKDKMILDIGAGTGRVSVPLAKAGAKVTALDVSEEMLRQVQGKSKKGKVVIETVVGDAESLPFEDNSFDMVVAGFLIVHLKDPTRFLDEAYRVLKDGGVLLVTNINQKDPPVVKTKEGDIIIESYYHRPERVREILESLAFGINEEIFVREGERWINQILLCSK